MFIQSRERRREGSATICFWLKISPELQNHDQTPSFKKCRPQDLKQQRAQAVDPHPNVRSPAPVRRHRGHRVGKYSGFPIATNVGLKHATPVRFNKWKVILQKWPAGESFWANIICEISRSFCECPSHHI